MSEDGPILSDRIGYLATSRTNPFEVPVREIRVRQPIYVDDLAAAAVARVTGETNETIDAIGPETFRYGDMVEMIARESSRGR